LSSFHFFAENFLSGGLTPKNENGVLKFALPITKTMDFYPVENLGGVTLSLFKNPNEHIGKEYGLASDTVDANEFINIFKEQTGIEKVFINTPSTKEFGGYFPGALELANMFEYYNLKAGNLRSPKDTKLLHKETTNLGDFFKNNKEFFTNLLK